MENSTKNLKTTKSLAADLLEKAMKEARETLAARLPQMMRDLPGKSWWTPAELTNESDQRTWGEFALLNRGRRVQAVRSVLQRMHTAGTADRVLGSDDGREVRVYKILNLEAN